MNDFYHSSIFKDMKMSTHKLPEVNKESTFQVSTTVGMTFPISYSTTYRMESLFPLFKLTEFIVIVYLYARTIILVLLCFYIYLFIFVYFGLFQSQYLNLQNRRVYS